MPLGSNKNFYTTNIKDISWYFITLSNFKRLRPLNFRNFNFWLYEQQVYKYKNILSNAKVR